MLLIAYGTRPEYIKLKPLFGALDIEFRRLFTGQHEDIAGCSADVYLQIKQGNNRLNDIVRSILEADFIFDGIDHVMVQGDTTSAFAIALAAFHRKIPVIHLEAGLRTHDISAPYPEEFNRVAIDRIASMHFCATENNRRNLQREGIDLGNVYITGNTGLDNLVGMAPEYGPTVFCTMHRRENHKKLAQWFSVISTLAACHDNLTFILPLHPNPHVQVARVYLSDDIHVLSPLSHEDSLRLLEYCRFVITDSGGVQEEASFLNKRAFICRQITERTECIGKTSILCETPGKLLVKFREHINDYHVDEECPYGDGKASIKIANILKGRI